MTRGEEKAKDRSKPICPFCGHEMLEVFVMISGGVWLSESRQRIRSSGHATRQEFLAPVDAELQTPVNKDEPPLHCVIGRDGDKRGTWPKDGLFCPSCLSFTVKPSPM